jgi:ribonuclease HI
MNKITVLSDVSLNAEMKIGFAACLIIPETQIMLTQTDFVAKEIKLKKFESTSSTKLEMESVLWAVGEVVKNNKEIDLYNNLTLYTDSQCIVGLLERRKKLESADFKSRKQRKVLNNAALYRKFYKLSDKFKFELIKLKGHSKKSEQDSLHKLFAYVDKAARKALKEHLADNDKRR